MYKVFIKDTDSDEELVIGDITTKDTSKRLLSGNTKQARNTVGSFEFDMGLDNQGYSSIKYLKTRIRVYNTKTRENEFEGRVLKGSNILEEDGKLYRSFTAENQLGYLMDSSQIYKKFTSLLDCITYMLNYHNSQVEDWKKIYPGDISFQVEGEFILNYKESLENLKDLINQYGGEIAIRVEDGKTYLDYKEIIGEQTETSIKVGVNLKKFEENIDPTTYFSRVIPLGSKIKVKDSEGNDVDSEERITIASINNNNIYVEDAELVKNVGRVTKTFEYDDIDDKNKLKENAIAELKKQSLSISNSITALDLSLLGLNFESFKVGNFYKIEVPFFDVNYYVRIIEKSIDINNPQTSNLTFGDKIIDIKKYQLEAQKQSKNYNIIKSEVENTAKKVEEISIDINTTIKKINSLEGNLSSYVTTDELNKKIDDINTNFNTINQELINIKERLDIEGGGTVG